MNSAKPKEKVVLVGLSGQMLPEEKAMEHLSELSFLAATSGATTIRSFLQKLEKPDNRTFVGKGKLQEISDFVEQNHLAAKSWESLTLHKRPFILSSTTLVQPGTSVAIKGFSILAPSRRVLGVPSR